MPNLFSSFANHASDPDHHHNNNNAAPQDIPPSTSSSEDAPSKQRLRRPSLLKNIRGWRRHNGENLVDDTSVPQTAPTELADIPEYFPPRRPSLPENVPPPSGKPRAIPSLPRPLTFRRQASERREKLLPVEERRAVSADRRRGRGVSPPQRPTSPKSVLLLPPPLTSGLEVEEEVDQYHTSSLDSPHVVDDSAADRSRQDVSSLEIPRSIDEPLLEVPCSIDRESDERDASSLREEFNQRWILNLSMHFRDKSNREKFFVTYAALPNQWRRLTISLDYRNAPANSLEADLSTLGYQRDKSLRIYEAIRESLADIQYYDTVTNLKLETTPEDGQLHVYVREDTNETIEFPALSLFDHISCPRVNEKGVDLESHLSGFVYRVRVGERVLIKKELPGPDTIDEFLYEVNALDSLLGCDNVVQLEGLVTDDRGELVKGLLISYASQGPLVDMIYDLRGTSQLPWHRREKWAKQIVSGLADIHEAGYVQGDFTLSNIVIDEDDNAIIIDINRRGCPVGWEPPELSKLIDSGQRIGMCIGVKTDLFQLGMVLWALAEEVDEPERVERPLPSLLEALPEYYRRVVKTCLRDRPQGRVAANELLRLFPGTAGSPTSLPSRSYVDFSHHPEVPTAAAAAAAAQRPRGLSEKKHHRSDKEYIDPDMAVTIDDVKERRRRSGGGGGATAISQVGSDQVIYVDPHSNPASTSYRFGSSGSWIVGGRRSRGRSPVSSRRRRSSPCGRSVSSATSVSGASSSSSSSSPKRRRRVVERSSPQVLEEKKVGRQDGTLLNDMNVSTGCPDTQQVADGPDVRDGDMAGSLRNRVAFQYIGSGGDEFGEEGPLHHNNNDNDDDLEEKSNERSEAVVSPRSPNSASYTPIPCSTGMDLEIRPRTLSLAGAQWNEQPHARAETNVTNDDIHDCGGLSSHRSEDLDEARTS